MAYSKHNFADGDVLTAEQLNAMETQIAANESAVNSIVMSYDSTGKYIYLSGTEEAAELYDGTIDFGNNIAYFPLSDFNENSTLLITIEEMSGNDIFTSTSILSGAAKYPKLGAIKGSSDVMYFYNNYDGSPKRSSIWSSVWSFPWKEMINSSTTTRNTPATSYADVKNDYSTWDEESSNLQSFNGFIGINLRSAGTNDSELTNYTTNAQLLALQNAGAVSAANETLKISCFKVWKDQTFSSIAAAEASTVVPDIWLRINASGKPVNAGSSGSIVYTGIKSAVISE